MTAIGGESQNRGVAALAGVTRPSTQSMSKNVAATFESTFLIPFPASRVLARGIRVSQKMERPGDTLGNFSAVGFPPNIRGINGFWLKKVAIYGADFQKVGSFSGEMLLNGRSESAASSSGKVGFHSLLRCNPKNPVECPDALEAHRFSQSAQVWDFRT
jgi:hypothetical protein